MSRIALCTWSDPRYVDPEPPAIAAELESLGHEADVVVWHDPAVDWASFDLVVIRSTWDYFDRLDEYLEWADRVAAVSRIINSPSVIRWNSHKGYLLELGEAGIPVLPSLALAKGAVDPVERMLATGWGEVVIKPAVDGGAMRALKAPATSPEASAHLVDLVAAADTIVQPYAAGVEAGEVSLFFFGGQLSHAVRKVPKPGDYRVQALHGGSEEVARRDRGRARGRAAGDGPGAGLAGLCARRPDRRGRAADPDGAGADRAGPVPADGPRLGRLGSPPRWRPSSAPRTALER